jgi:UDPglucose--hexose-1-phosphate uridylyltransferase
VRERFQQALNHYDEYGECMFCQSLEEEIADRQRVLLLTEHFVAPELYASPTPFRTPIYPRRHMASFGDISAAEIADLAGCCEPFSRSSSMVWGTRILTSPFAARARRIRGCEALPLVCQHPPASNLHGGLRTGIWNVYNTVLPEAAAEFLRNVKVELAAGAS